MPDDNKRFLAVGCGGLSGLIFSLSIPKADIGLLAWICFLPAFLALRYTRHPLTLGITTGIVAGIGRIYWITETLQLFGGLGPVLALATNILLIAYLTLYPALFFYGIHRLDLGDPRLPWVAAAAWVLLEWFQSWVITGFPWELVGYSQYRHLHLSQIASITGVYGLSFLILLVNATLAQVAAAPRLWRRLLAPIALLGTVLCYGVVRLDDLNNTSHTSLTVGIVQGNFPQDIKWDRDRVAQTAAKYTELSHTLADQELDLLVYPETALPFRFRHPNYAQHRALVEAAARSLETPILVGSLDAVETGTSEALYNRAFLLDRDGKIVSFSDKIHLVPFGEYIPFPDIFQYLEGLTEESGAFAHGIQRPAMEIPESNERLGLFVCYEAVFPEISRDVVKKGATLLINITNDAWFGRTAAPYQHLAMSAFRAIETGRSVVRVANTGISCLISPAGAISDATGLFQTAAFSVNAETRTETTLYVRFGDFLVWICALYLLAEIGRRWRSADCSPVRSTDQRPSNLPPDDN